MNYKKFLGAVSAALMIVIAILLLVPGAWAASKYKTLYKFEGGKDGSGPNAGLVFDAAGNLYGTTGGGGKPCNCGVVFKLHQHPDGSWTESVLYRFTDARGKNPSSGLVFDAAGNLFGTTLEGGGDGTVGITAVGRSSGCIRTRMEVGVRARHSRSTMARAALVVA